MLVRCRVAHEIRPVAVKDLHDALAVAHGADEHDQIQLRMRAPQLHLDVVGIILVDIENDEPLRPLCRRLTAELAADAAAAARDEHGLAGDVGRDLIEVDLHRLAAEQVLDVHLADLLDAHLAVGELADAGQCAQGAGRVVAVVEDLQLLLPGSRRDGEDDLVNVVLFRHRGDAAAAADDLHAAQIAADLVRRIVNDAHDLVFRARAGLKLAQHDGAGLTAADEHGALAALTVQPDARAARVAVGKAQRPAQQAQNEHIDGRKAARHGQMQHEHADHVKHRREKAAHGRAHQLRYAGKLPQAVIQLQDIEDQDRAHGVDAGIDDHIVQKLRFAQELEIKFKPYVERQKCRQIDQDQIRQHEAGHAQRLLRVKRLVAFFHRIPPSARTQSVPLFSLRFP